MGKSHPDFGSARSHLSSIMQKIIKGTYDTPEEYVESMENWIKRWSDKDQVSPMDPKDQIIALGRQHHIIISTNIGTGDLLYGKPKRIFSKINPIATEATIKTVQNQIVDPVLSGLYNIKKVNGTQGWCAIL